MKSGIDFGKTKIEVKNGIRTADGIYAGRATMDIYRQCGICLKKTNRAFVWKSELEICFKHSVICNSCWDLIRSIPSSEEEIRIGDIKIETAKPLV